MPETDGETARLGVLTPSSNTVLEPITYAILNTLPAVTAHFSRFRVTRASADADAAGQFAPAPMVDAALLLADADVDAISWSGTSGAWLGTDHDRALCDAIREQSGRPATSAILALREVLAATGVRRIGLVTPFTAELQAMIVANLEKDGLVCAAERHLDLVDNRDFANVPVPHLRTMAIETMAARPDAICILCTNLRGALVVRDLEAELGIPVYDSAELAIWGALRLTSVSPLLVKERGRLFDLP
jgi:maleate isomerase